MEQKMGEQPLECFSKFKSGMTYLCCRCWMLGIYSNRQNRWKCGL